jgi:ABC-type cobalamin/Fe3+-siderophores transport system ATPase subunit
VLHDLNHACRYADQIIAMKPGRIVAQGDPKSVITEELVENVHGLKCQIIDDPRPERRWWCRARLRTFARGPESRGGEVRV